MPPIPLLLLLLSSPVIAGDLGLIDPDGPDDAPIGEVADGTVRRPLPTLRWGGGEIRQWESTWLGLPVVGGRQSVLLGVDGAVRDTVGEGLRVAPFTSVAVLHEGAAVEAAVEWMQDEVGPVGDSPPRVNLVVFTRDGVGSLAWSVDLRTLKPQSSHRVFIDAVDGRVLGDQQTTFTALADVYPTNPDASELTEVEIDTQPDRLQNVYANVSSCADWDDESWMCNEKERQAIPDADGNFIFEPAPTSLQDPFAEVQMFFHIDLAGHFFEDEFDFRADYGMGPTAVEGIVNFNLQNAFFGDADGDGRPEIAFGQGGGIDYAYDADVIYHEFGHGVFGQVVENNEGRYDNYGKLVAPYGLNEGTADLLSMTISGDPLLGEYAGGGPLGSGPIRDLGPDRHCPVDVYGESHEDGEMWAALGWNLIEDPLIGQIPTAHLVMGALARWPEEGLDWTVAGNSLIESSDDLLDSGFIGDAQHQRIFEIVDAAGFVDCTRWVPLDDGQEPKQLLTARMGGDGNPRTPPLPNPFALDAPEGTTELRFYVEGWDAMTDGIGWKVYVRRGEPVWFDLQVGQNGRVTAVPQDYDAVFEGEGEGRAVRLNADTDPPLEPGATYHFAMTGALVDEIQGFGAVEVTVRGEIDWTTPVEPEPPVDEVAGDGCQGCQGQGTAAFLPALFLLRPRRRSPQTSNNAIGPR